MAALLAASAVMLGSLVNWAWKAPVPAADVPQPPTTAAALPPPTLRSEPKRSPAPSRPPALFATDDRGFVNSTARCDGTLTAVAVGRTARSVVVICGDDHGSFEYLGVRLSDDAMLKAAAETAPTNRFLARNAGVVYAVSANELLVTAGGAVIKNEPMLEFRVRSGL
jgi:hypothetical protein